MVLAGGPRLFSSASHKPNFMVFSSGVQSDFILWLFCLNWPIYPSQYGLTTGFSFWNQTRGIRAMDSCTTFHVRSPGDLFYENVLIPYDGNCWALNMPSIRHKFASPRFFYIILLIDQRFAASTLARQYISIYLFRGKAVKSFVQLDLGISALPAPRTQPPAEHKAWKCVEFSILVDVRAN